MSDRLSDLLSYCRERERVCPVPMRWNDLYQLLPGTRQKGLGWEPPLPLILAAWWEASDDQKAERLAEHIKWADDHGALDSVARFVRALPESDWHHNGE